MEDMYLTNYVLWIWGAAGLTLLFLEIMLGFPMVMFICGLAAFTTALIVWVWPNLGQFVVYQIVVFLLGIPCWTLILWKPLKSALDKHKHGENFSNIIGQVAIVDGDDLVKGRVGNIRWSGTIVKAKLLGDNKIDIVLAGESVRIVAVRENIFIVKTIN